MTQPTSSRLVTEAANAAVSTADRARTNHTGTQTADTITDGTTNKAYTATEKTKLAGIATAATANRTDAATDTLLAAKADLVAGVIPSAQIPALALANTQTVASQAAMLALTTTQVQPGDIAVRTDGAGTFILTATDPTVLGNWVRLNAPTDAVTTVNGQAGTVVLAKADVGLGNVDNTSDAGKPVSTATSAAIGNSTINLPVNVMSANGTAVIGARNAVNASAGPVAVVLPNPTAVGQHVIIERSDASAVTANAVTITGTIRGTANTVVTLAAVGAANEGGHYIAESLTSWAIAGSIKPKAVLDKYYDANGAAAAILASPAFTGTPTRAVGAAQRALRAGPYQPYLGPVSNRSRTPVTTGIAVATYAEYMTWRLYKAADDIPAAALVYGSFYNTQENGATGVTGAVQASIEYPVGTITRITFASGGTTGTIPANGLVQSDLTTLATSIPAGARFWVGTYVQWTGTGNVPRFQDGMYIQSGTSNAQATAARESHLGGAAGSLTNTVLTGVRGTNGGVSSKTGDSFGPIAVLGMTQRPTVFIAGDSQANMQVPPAITGQDSEGLQGVIEQIIGQRVGYINGACNSDQYSFANTTGQYTNRLALSAYCSHIIDEYGVNSIYGQNLATNTTDLTTFRAKFPATKPYLKTTVIPKVTGAWIKPDLSDQTPVATLANFTAFNAFIRQGANGLIDGHIDLEDVTGYRDSGKIKPAQRYVTDAAITSATNTITSTAAAFTVTDIGKVVCVIGAGASAANLIGVIATVPSASTCTIVAIDSSALTAGTTVSGAGMGIGLYTYDGVHQTRLREADIRDSIIAQRAVAPILQIG